MEQDNSKPVVLLLGKLPPPYMGPSIATQILLQSTLKEKVDLLHLDTKAYQSLNDFGKWSLQKIKKTFSIYWQMIRIIKRQNPVIVWIPISQTTTGFLKDAVFIWIALIAKKKTVLHLRGSNFRKWYESSSVFMQFFTRQTIKRCSGAIVLGQQLKYIFQPFLNMDDIYVVPNGGDYHIPQRNVNATGKIQLLYLANLQTSKGIEDVIQAMAILNKSHHNRFELHVAGTWRNTVTRGQCLALTAAQNLPVLFHPPASLNEKMQFLANADIFIFTPREPEGHPWVIVEAMAAGLPIISTNKGAISESVADGMNGYLVPSENPAAIADKLVNLIENPSLRKRFGEESRIYYVKGFTEQKMVDRIVNTFATVLSK